MTDPIIKRGPIRTVTGIEVDSLSLSLLVNSDVLVGNIPLAQFARQGGFDGARLSVSRSFANVPGAPACGSVNLFSGRVAELTVSGTEVKMEVKSDLELLNIQMPRNIYMAQCVHTLYDAGCGLGSGTYTVTGNTTANSTTRQVNCNLAQAAGYFDLGVVTFTTGQNAGVERTVKTHTTGVLVPTFPFPYTPAAGDLLTARPGCDKQYATCNSAKFSNAANHRGFEFIPAPELSY